MERGALEGTLPQAAGSEAVHSTDGTGLREPCAPRPCSHLPLARGHGAAPVRTASCSGWWLALGVTRTCAFRGSSSGRALFLRQGAWCHADTHDNCAFALGVDAH